MAAAASWRNAATRARPRWCCLPRPYGLRSPPVLEPGHDVVAVHAGDEIDGDLFRAHRLALAEHGAAPEVLLHHPHHVEHALVALGLSLRQKSQVRDLGGGEELRGAVRTLRHAGAALDALRGVHGALLHHLRDGRVVGLRRAAGVDGDEAAGLHDAVERLAVDDEVLDDGKGARAPRLDTDLVAVAEVAHVQLARRRAAERPVRDAVDRAARPSADA